MLQGQFVDPRQQQLEEEAEVVGDPPVPVVIKGELDQRVSELLNERVCSKKNFLPLVNDFENTKYDQLCGEKG